MNIIIGTVYYHKRLKIRVTVLAIYPTTIWVRAENDKGNSFLTSASDLQEIVSMSGDEILRREG